MIHPAWVAVFVFVILVLVAIVIDQAFKLRELSSKLRELSSKVETHRDWLRVRWSRAWCDADARELDAQRAAFARHLGGEP